MARFIKPKRESEFENALLEIRRVTRVMAGGKRFGFRASVVAGDRRGRIGLGIGRAKDVSQAIEKATRQAEKHVLTLPLYKGTIPHSVTAKYGAAKLLLKPAPTGAGIIAGGPIRAALKLSGIQDVSAKILGTTNNKISNVRALLVAFKKLKTKKEIVTKQENAPSSTQTTAEK